MENKLRENAFRTETQGEAERQKGNALLKDLQEKEQTLERETGGVLMRLAEKFADGMASKAAFIALLLSSHVLSTRLAGEALELPKDIPSLERPVAKEEQEVREMRERIVAFFEEIGIYKKLGYNVEVETGITGFNEKQDTLDASFELQDISREMIQEAE